MAIRELIEQLKHYADLPSTSLDTTVIMGDGSTPSIFMSNAQERWTDGGDPYMYYIVDPDGDKEVVVIR